MIEGVGVAVIRCSASTIIDFVTDLERYKTADLKIGRVLENRRDGDHIFMRHDGKLRGIPGPAVALELTVDGERAVRYRSVPNCPSRLILTFEGGFELDATADGTRVVHTERFNFHAPWRWLAEPFLRRWLSEDVRAEMVRMKAILEAESGAPDEPSR
jgi:hypothetical protein